MSEDEKPPLAKELAGVQVHYTWKLGEGRARLPEPPASPDDPQAQLRQLTAALEDIVALALSSADYKERAIMMHRRAVAALSTVEKKR
ncbi:MAG TPA: hypothetical protein VFI96_00650 [Longimicrobiaceae bacterium]|nr:hypothetical protein [Longimicrobiaceae bacterium]